MIQSFVTRLPTGISTLRPLNFLSQVPYQLLTCLVKAFYEQTTGFC